MIIKKTMGTITILIFAKPIFQPCVHSSRYMDQKGQLWSIFLDLLSVPDGRAATLVSAIKNVLQVKNIPTQKLFGLGTDGAAVMTGM